MNTNEDKPIEKLVDRMMKNQALETPSFDFTSKVMAKVLESKKSYATIYTPLISKQAGFVVLGALTLLTLLLLTSGSTGASRFAISMSYNIVPDNFSKLFSFSKIGAFSLSLTAIMLLLQITLLKRHFQKD